MVGRHGRSGRIEDTCFEIAADAHAGERSLTATVLTARADTIARDHAHLWFPEERKLVSQEDLDEIDLEWAVSLVPVGEGFQVVSAQTGKAIATVKTALEPWKTSRWVDTDDDQQPDGILLPFVTGQVRVLVGPFDGDEVLELPSTDPEGQEPEKR